MPSAIEQLRALQKADEEDLFKRFWTRLGYPPRMRVRELLAFNALLDKAMIELGLGPLTKRPPSPTLVGRVKDDDADPGHRGG